MPPSFLVRLDQSDEGVLERRVRQARSISRIACERLGRIDRDAFAAVNQRDAVAVFGLVHEVRGHHDGDAARRPSR